MVGSQIERILRTVPALALGLSRVTRFGVRVEF
jgi:hypothetical protein